ncbi:hypothetical protein GCM10009682_28170 [Luedemannella flava]|uniref:Uncharacterized protein n=1 Tax=Luedemannella flava TaxID=349316 RepID=A0ABP4YBM2_9ACTN
MRPVCDVVQRARSGQRGEGVYGSTLGANHHNRARRVVGTVLADRTQQGPDEAAVAVAADHQQVRPTGRIDEHGSRMTPQHPLPHHNIGVCGGCLSDNTGQRLLCGVGQIFAVDHRRPGSKAGEDVPRDGSCPLILDT